MCRIIQPLRLSSVLFVFAVAGSSSAQAPPSIQFFMPGGDLPSREIRFTLEMDNGRVESFYSDSRGKFLLTRTLGLKPDAQYRVTVTSDGTSFGTTTYTFKEYGVYYIPIYLRPLESPATPAAKVIDLAELDDKIPSEAKQSYGEAMRQVREGQTDQAIRSLEHALAISPEYFRALNDLGVIYMKTGRLDDASRMFERASRIAPRVYYPRLNLAIIKTRQAKYKEAVAALEVLLKENQSVSEVRIALGDALIALDRLDEAEPHLRTALRDARLDRETSGDAHYRLGLLLNKQQKYEAAVVELNSAAEQIPRSARTHLQLGGALLQLKRFDDAERELLEAYRLGGAQMGGAQLMLGQVYFIEKKFESARRAFEQYLSDVPDAPNATQVKGLIEKINSALRQK